MLEFLEKKETKIAAIAVILIIILVIVLFQQNTVKQTKDSLEHEAGEELVLEAKDFFDAEEDILAEMKIDASEVNTNKVGEYEATATYKSKEYGYGGIIDEANDWYVYEVREVRELITPDEDEFWD